MKYTLRMFRGLGFGAAKHLARNEPGDLNMPMSQLDADARTMGQGRYKKKALEISSAFLKV
ncbi:hypothetical protein [uncultured Pontibacter sp.]|uniref:hypothetical protein n=1 Tax=uncultured Pontibacter sp. TaxID=453356 RepID=UPI00261FC187|nr:hypothetical protein [uncultured Pontibacter sp.]